MLPLLTVLLDPFLPFFDFACFCSGVRTTSSPITSSIMQRDTAMHVKITFLNSKRFQLFRYKSAV